MINIARDQSEIPLSNGHIDHKQNLFAIIGGENPQEAGSYTITASNREDGGRNATVVFTHEDSGVTQTIYTKMPGLTDQSQIQTFELMQILRENGGIPSNGEEITLEFS